MKSKKGIISAITVVIVGLMIAGTATAATYKQPTDNSISVIQSKPLQMVMQGNSPQPLDATPVTDTGFNSYHPSVAFSPTGIFYGSAEVSQDGSTWQPGVFSSDAEGAVWTETVEFTYPGAQYTGLAANSVGTYGTFGAPPDQSSLAIFYQAENPDVNNGVWDWGSLGFANLFYDDIAAYDDPNPNATDYGWNLVLTGDYNTDTGVPMAMYQEFGPNNYGIMTRATGRTGYLHAANSIDQAKLLSYNVYDRNDGTNLFVRVINLAVWTYSSASQYYYHPDKKSLEIDETQFQVMYPSVAAENNTVLIVAQTINGSGSDVICYQSTNGLTSYNRIMVANSADDETYPQVYLTGPGSAVCTYCKNGALYFKQTDDSGATWGPETKVDDSQVNAEYRCEALTEKLGGAYGVWEDTRDSVINIYFDSIGTVPKVPLIKIGTISSSIGHVSAVIENAGTGDATTVDWNITLAGGLIILGKQTTGTEATIATGGQATVTSKFIFGFGKPTVTVTAICSEGSSDTATVTTQHVFLFFVKI